MYMNLIKILAVVLAVMMIVSLTMLVSGTMPAPVFWVIVLFVAFMAYYGLPRMRKIAP
jgi:hypothetical protein